MKANTLSKLLIAGALMGAAGAVSADTILFADNFDAADPEALNWDGNGQWTITNGTVDLIDSGSSYGINCLGSTGKCVDLDGSTSNAGILSTATFNLLANQTYKLTAYFSGSQRDGISEDPLNDPNEILFGLKTAGNATLASLLVGPLTWDAAFNLYTVLFTPTSDVAAKIFFSSVSGQDDNVGAILDSTALVAVPLPAAAWLLLSGLAGVGALSRRRRLAAA